MNEKYGVELEAITDGFTSKMKQLEKQTEAFGKIAKSNLTIDPNIKIEEAQKRLNEIEKRLAELDKMTQTRKNVEIDGRNIPINFNSGGGILSDNLIGEYNQLVEEQQKLSNIVSETTKKRADEVRTIEEQKNKQKEQTEEVKKTNNELEKAKPKLVKIVNNTSEANSKFKILTNTISKGFNKSTSSIKRFTLSLFGVHSIYFALSRAVNTYKQYDKSLTNQMQASWAGLGAFMAPIVNYIGKLVMRVVGYLNVFIRTLTGIDFINKANDNYKLNKQLEATSKNAKNAAKSLTAMDEITNLQDNSSSSGLGSDDFNPFQAIQDVELNNKWVKTMQNLGTTIRKVYEENIKPVFDKIKSFFTNEDGSIDWVKVLTNVIAIGLAFKLWKISPKLAIAVFLLSQLIGSVLNYVKDPSWKKFGDILKWIGIGLIALGIGIGAMPLVVAGVVVAILGIYAKYWEDIKKIAKKGGKWLEDNFGLIGKQFSWHIQMSLTAFEGLFIGIRQMLDGMLKFLKGDFKGGIKLAIYGIVNVIFWVINLLINNLNVILTPLRSIIVALANIGGKKVKLWDVKIPQIPYLDTGTNYVQDDGLAYIHKGEAVVPKKFNSQEFFGRGSEKTDALLMELISAVEENGDKTPVFNINGREFAKATYEDYYNETNRINRNTIIRRA